MRRPEHRPPPRALAGRDRAADRREPRRRPARAAGAGAAAPGAAARPAHRAAADGAARRGWRRSKRRRRSTRCCGSWRRARTAGCPSIAARSTTSSASCTRRMSCCDFVERAAAATVMSLLRPTRPRPETHARRSPARASCASGAATRRSSSTTHGAVVGMITLEDVVAELLGGVSDEFKGATARAILPARRQRPAARLDAPRPGGAGPGRRLARRRRYGRQPIIARVLGGLPAAGEAGHRRTA